MDNAYFTHGVHTTTLNSKECKLLNETLKKKTGRLVNNKEETIWMLIRDKWNMANPHAYIGDCVDQPDYSTIIMY